MKYTPFPFPSGLEDFRELVTYRNTGNKPYAYIDKTLFIQELIDNRGVILITRPRRFGKTLNLSMLQHFFAPEVQGISTKGLFDGLKIAQYPKVMEHQGQYPVIFLTLKNMTEDNIELMTSIFRQTIQKLYGRHTYLLEEPGLLEELRNFRRVLAEEGDITIYTQALLNLSEYIFKVKRKKAIILIEFYGFCNSVCVSFFTFIVGFIFFVIPYTRVHPV